MLRLHAQDEAPAPTVEVHRLAGRDGGVSSTFASELEAGPGLGADHEPEWLAALRRLAWQRFQEIGLPTTKDEDWRFTPIAPIAQATITRGLYP